MEIISASTLQTELFNFIDSSDNRYFINSIVGTPVLNIIIDAIKTRFNINRILFVNGIQDDKYLIDELYENNIYYAELFETRVIPGINEYDEFKPGFANDEMDSCNVLRVQFINDYDIMIILNAHMIEDEYISTILNTYSGKIICVADPFDIYGEAWSLYPTLLEPVTKLPNNITYARFLYGLDSYGVDKKNKGIVKYNVRLNRRTVGKIDSNQYITNDWNFLNEINEKQYNAKLKRNYKLILINTMNSYSEHEVIREFYDPENNKIRHSIKNGSLLKVVAANDTNAKVKLHQTNIVLPIKYAYRKIKFLTPSDVLLVRPANILYVTEACKHRFKSAVVVTTPENPTLTIRQQYTLLKMCDNIIFAYVK